MAYVFDSRQIVDRVNRHVKLCKCGVDAKVFIVHGVNYEEDSAIVVCKNGHRGDMQVLPFPSVTALPGNAHVDAILEAVWKWNNPFPTVEEYMEHYA